MILIYFCYFKKCHISIYFFLTKLKKVAQRDLKLN